MIKFSEGIKNIPETEFPQGLHKKIMRSVYFIRLENYFFAPVTIFLILSILFSGWNLIQKINELQSFPAIKALFEGFRMDFDFAVNMYYTFIESVPLYYLLIFFISLVVMVFVGCMYRRFNRLGRLDSQRSIV